MLTITKENFERIIKSNGFDVTINEDGNIEGKREVKYGNTIETVFINNSDTFIIWKPNGTKKFYSGKTYAQANRVFKEIIKWWK